MGIRRPDVPEVATKTTKDLLGSIFRRDMFDDEASARREAEEELWRRVEVVLKGQRSLGNYSFQFLCFSMYAAKGASRKFTVEFIAADENGKSYLRGLGDQFYLAPSVELTGDNKYKVTFNVFEFEQCLVENGEPAGLHVDEDPLHFDEITRARISWVNRRFDEAVQPHIEGSSTAFMDVSQTFSGVKIYACTASGHGDDRLCQYVLKNKPLGFYINYAGRQPGRGVYINISYENFKKLLPSSVVEEGAAEVACDVDGVIGGKVGSEGV